MELGGKLSKLLVRCNSESPSLLYGYPGKTVHTVQNSNVSNYFLMLRKLKTDWALKMQFLQCIKNFYLKNSRVTQQRPVD